MDNVEKYAMTTSHDSDDPALRFHESGFRITSQRRIVLDVIASFEGHPTAEDVYERARVRSPRISLATVYRTLSVLKQMGLIKQRYISQDHARTHFEAAEAEDHFHFQCIECGKVIEFRNEAAVAALCRGLIEAGQVAQVVQICACVEGYCSACAPQPVTR
jgi:Fe2+ or Zn2+ uptake regulation protein